MVASLKAFFLCLLSASLSVLCCYAFALSPHVPVHVPVHGLGKVSESPPGPGLGRRFQSSHGAFRQSESPNSHPPSVVVAILNNCLRLHDNPLLRSIVQGRFQDATILPVLLRSQGDDYESATWVQPIVKIAGTALPTLLHNVQSQHSQMTVMYCESSIEPFRSLLKSSLPADLNYDVIASNDDLVPNLGIKSSSEEDQSFSNYKDFYYTGDNVPDPIMSFPSDQLQFLSPELMKVFVSTIDGAVVDLPQQPTARGRDSDGESEALALVRDYLELGDRRFSDTFFKQYMQLFSKEGDQFGSSLPRLLNVDENKSYLFEGEVFNALIAPFLTQGVISPRLLYHARRGSVNGLGSSRLSLLRWFQPHPSCLMKDVAIRNDWHKKLASSMEPESGLVDGGPWRQMRFRYWKGFVQREAATNDRHCSASVTTKPILVFVHGFGGSLQQFEGLAGELYSAFDCIAVDSLGFGYSEKPTLSYNQYLWSDQIYDLIQSVISERSGPIRVVVAGNSIGGFSAASVAARLKRECSDVECAGLVLMNSAGRILGADDADFDDEGFLPDENLLSPYRGPSPRFLQIFGKALFALLQPNIARLCEWLYPSNPKIVEQKGLAKAIFRDSGDMGATDVLAAGGKLPKPESMDSLFAKFNGPVLIAQGVLDPLNNATERARQFGNIRGGKGVTIEELQLGHCPMEENPALVAQAILKWSYAQAIL